MRMLVSRSWSIFVVAVLLASAAKIYAGAKKEWVTLSDCQYLDAADNDGDSFRVRAGDKEFTARLYYVDAPETNLKQAERTREQSIHFGITLDDTLKAGTKAKDDLDTKVKLAIYGVIAETCATPTSKEIARKMSEQWR